MFLKSLTLKGFKSFAQTTTIDLGSGLSVVVGPNGSGKSNIVDAIAWVLGSQAPTALRSQQMDDVIFAGNPGRPALGRAEVTLTLDNEDRRLPLDLDEVAITRTLFRSGDSGYAINAAPARLVDIAELLAAAGVGRHRHVIVSQGRIDAVLSAKPAERRAILEEAAGVSAYRLRKEKALRRLADTEANLARLADQLSEVRRALRPLEQQAETARRHGALATELESLQIHRLGTELAGLRGQRREAAARRRDLADRRAVTGRELAAVDGRIGEAEARLSAVSHVELAEATERLGLLRDRVLQAQQAATERRRDYERRRRDHLDSDLLVALSDEAATIEAALAESDDAEAALAAERGRIAAAGEVLAGDAAAHAARWESPEGAGQRSSAAQLRGRLMTLRDVAERAEAEVTGLDERSALLEERSQAAGDSLRRAAEAVAARRGTEEAARRALEAAEERRGEAAGAEAAARRAQGEAAAEHARWRSRVEALALAMGDVRARSGMEVLAGSDGVLGALADLVAVDDGWEAAFEAAAGEALAAAVVDGPGAARPALAALAAAQVAGAVLPAHRASVAPPPVGEPLRPHVRARRRGVDEVLDGLIGSVVVVPGWREACDAIAAHPDATVVTPAGDRFSRTGWRVGVSRSGATGEALAESRDGLGRAEGTLAAAERAVEQAASAAAAAVAHHAEAAAAHRAAGRELTEARRQEADAERRHGAARAEAAAVAERLAELTDSAGRHRRLAEETAAQLAERLEAAEAAEASAAGGRAALEDRRATLAAERQALEVRASEIGARRGVLAERLSEIRDRLAGHTAAVAAAGADARRSAALADLAERLGAAAAECQDGLEELRRRRRAAAEALSATAAQLDADRRRRAGLAASLDGHAEELLAAQRAEDEIGLRIEAVVETLRGQYDCDELRATQAAAPDLAEGVTVAGRIRELERLLRRIGPVNPLAVREHDILRERHDLLASQVADVRSARRDLNSLVRAIDAEITEAFSRCYREVAESFEALFGVLFAGGAGRLSLTEPDNPLDSGVEIEARPAGKNLRRLALLSGGERSLAALAFLFAVFQSQNSPFYVLDEVDAALDDVNLHRFLRLLEEFRSEAQLLLVTHQRPTMEIADRLYGVTMRPGGASRVIAERRDGEGAPQPAAVAGSPER